MDTKRALQEVINLVNEIKRLTRELSSDKLSNSRKSDYRIALRNNRDQLNEVLSRGFYI